MTKALGIPVESVINILQLGFSGVAFIFLYMSFKLLREEQIREAFPRQHMLKAIKQFSLLSVVFATLIFTTNIYEYHINNVTPTKTTSEVVNKCDKAILRAKLAISKPEEFDKNLLLKLIDATVTRCDPN